MSEKEKRFRMILNVLIAVTVTYQWLRMVFSFQDGVLSSRGFGSLRYFTVLSNLFEGAASLFLVYVLARGKDTKKAELMKYAACVSVMVTFITVMVFLGPRFGYALMFAGVSFWMHLIVPLTALAEFLWKNGILHDLKERLLSILLLCVYGVGYISNLIVNGYGEHNANDWYGFGSWGIPAGIGILCLIIVLTYCLSVLLDRVSVRLFRTAGKEG